MTYESSLLVWVSGIWNTCKWNIKSNGQFYINFHYDTWSQRLSNTPKLKTPIDSRFTKLTAPPLNTEIWWRFTLLTPKTARTTQHRLKRIDLQRSNQKGWWGDPRTTKGEINLAKHKGHKSLVWNRKKNRREEGEGGKSAPPMIDLSLSLLLSTSMCSNKK